MIYLWLWPLTLSVLKRPFPGQSLVGIEVPNQKVAIVTLRELLESHEFKTQEHHEMMIALGKDVVAKSGLATCSNAAPAGGPALPGSGKTVCINTIILSLLYQNTAATLRIIMVDPNA